MLGRAPARVAKACLQAPDVWIPAAVFLKLVWFGLTLRSVWWTLDDTSLPAFLVEHQAYLWSSAASVAVIFAPLFLARGRLRLALLVLVDIALTAIVLIDGLHAGYYGDIPSIQSVSAASTPGHLTAVWSSVRDRLSPWHAVFFADVVIAGGLLFLVRRPAGASPGHRGVTVATWLFAMLFLAIPVVQWRLEESNANFTLVSLQREVCLTFGLPAYHVFDAVFAVAPRMIEPDRAAAALDHVRARRASLDGHRSALFGAARGRNLILIAVESLQQFVLGLEVQGREVTPNLNALARESLAFEGIYDQTHLGTTADSEFAVLHALYPAALGTTATSFHASALFGLPAILAESGYSTISSVASDEAFWNRGQTHPGFGFAESLFGPQLGAGLPVHDWLNDRDFLARSAGRLTTEPDPFMAFLITASSHHPFGLPPWIEPLPVGDLKGTDYGNYLQALHYVDGAIGEFLGALRTNELLDKSVVAVFGDHQAFLSPTPALLKALKVPEDDSIGALLERKAIPFLVRLPGGAQAGTRRVVGGQVDIPPTLLALLGIPDRNLMGFGRDLTKAPGGRVVFRDGSFIQDGVLMLNGLVVGRRARCADVSTRKPLDCSRFSAAAAEARRELETSDALLQANGLRTFVLERRQWIGDLPPLQAPAQEAPRHYLSANRRDLVLQSPGGAIVAPPWRGVEFRFQPAVQPSRGGERPVPLIFEVSDDRGTVFRQRVQPGEYVRPVALRTTGKQVTFRATPETPGDSATLAVWRNLSVRRVY